MNLDSNISSIRESIHKIFSKQRKTVRENLFLVITSLLQCKNCQTPQIISEMCKLTGKNFKANENRLARFFDSSEFKIDDCIWREYTKMILNLMIERGYLKKGDNVCINIDFTTKRDEFLILSASIQFKGRSIPLCFSMRCYPKKAGQINQKLMEKAFIEELSRLLPHEDYTYTIVADRGFGNMRFLELCQRFGFNYVIRIPENRLLEINEIKQKLSDINENVDLKSVKLPFKEQMDRLIKSSTNNENKWYILTNLSDEACNEVIEKYKNRFQCEKMFQDEKSSGFDIEISKIKKYSRFKRLLFCIYVCQGLMNFLGDWINGEAEEIRKKYYLHINLVSAFSKLQNDY